MDKTFWVLREIGVDNYVLGTDTRILVFTSRKAAREFRDAHDYKGVYTPVAVTMEFRDK